MRRFPFVLGLLALFAPLLPGCAPGSSAPAQETGYAPRVPNAEVEVVEVQREPLSADVEFTGSLLPRRYTRIVAEVDGIVREIPQVGTKFDIEHQGRHYSEQLAISYGQPVKKDDVLLQLDARDFEIQLRMAQARLKKAQADLAHLMAWRRPEELQRLTALRDEARARRDEALKTLERFSSLVERNVVSQSEYDRARTEADTTKAVLAAAEANLAAAGAGPTEHEIAIQQALVLQAEAEVQEKEREIEKATIRAPYDGVVTAFHAEVGDRVSAANGPVVELMDLRYLIAEIGVPEAYIGRIAVKDRAEVRVAGEVQPVAGLVVAINEMVDAKTRTFRVRVAIDNLRQRFKAGQFAEVQLQMAASGNQVLTVPSRSITFVEGQPHVFVVEEGRVRLQDVRIGMSSATHTEILDGLSAGTRVVTEDPTLLSDGMNVTVKTASG